MSWIAVAVGVGGSLIGGMMSADAAGDASAAQQQSAREASAVQLAMYNNNVALSAPAINTGNAARDRLAFLLGLSGTGFSNSTLPQAQAGTGGSSPGSGYGMGQSFGNYQPTGSGSTYGGYSSTQPLTYDQLRAQLLPQFTTRNYASGSGAKFDINNLDMLERVEYERARNLGDEARLAFEQAHLGNASYTRGNNEGNVGVASDTRNWNSPSGPTSEIDEAGLDAMIRERLRAQEAEAAQREAAARADPRFGSLTEGFQFGTYNPGTFSYTGEDLYDDPSYQFRLQQGQKALDRQGLAAGRFFSGGQLQASSDYNQGAASQEFQNAYARARDTFGVNETGRYNAFNTNESNRFNAYQTNFQNTVNPLLALSGAGQLSGGQLMQANQQTAGAIGGNIIGAGNAAAAGAIGQANGINQGLGGAINSFQTNSLLQRFGNTNNNPTFISPTNQASFDSLGGASNWWGTAP